MSSQTLQCSPLEVWFVSSLYLVSQNFLNICSPKLPLSSSADSHICFSSGWFWPSFSSWVMFPCFSMCLMIFGHQARDLVGAGYFYSRSWALFWEAVKMLGNSLVLSGLAFVICQAWSNAQATYLLPTSEARCSVSSTRWPWVTFPPWLAGADTIPVTIPLNL